MIRLAILASGTGTNAENIIRYFTGHALISAALVISNKPDAKLVQKAGRHHVPAMGFPGQHWKNPAEILEMLSAQQIDYLILAGFLLKLHPEIVSAFPNKILNIHPALLPRYGGKGMYGDYVHQAVIDAGEKTTGITIHLVNEHYDEGKIIFMAECPVLPDDTTETLSRRVHELEYRHFPKVIESYIFPGRL
ncbi:MAG: phosphoribosylglycinamide formyltransferase [Bacteroidales bacterium]